MDGTKVNVLNIIKREITRPRHPIARRNTTFYPSSASAELANGSVLGGCWRADWYRIHGVLPSDESGLYMHMIWHLGRAVEAKLIDAMKCAGIYETEGVKFFDPELNVSGELDIVGRYRLDGQIRFYGIEVKSVYGMGTSTTITGRARAWRGQAAFDPFPKESNLMQVMTYLDQFSKERGDRFELDFFKLIYMPRDKPNDGREYTISLVTKEEISPGLRTTFGAEMKDGHEYALVRTDGFSDKIETRFSLQDMHTRWRLEMQHFKEGTMVPRPFKKFYSETEVEDLYAQDGISKTGYENWVKAGKPNASLEKTPGHYLCQSYCDYRSFCYTKQGLPRKEADLVGIADPKELETNEENET